VESDVLDSPATPDRIGRLAAAGTLTGDDVARAYAAASATPSRADWARLVDRTLLVLGALLTVAGVVFFVAYNWEKIAAFGKFGILGACIALAVIVAHHRTLARPSGQIALVVAALLVGPLLAVYGQHYQTGADPFELFASWTLLALPWAVAARSSLLWAVLIGLADTTAGLYAEQVLAADDASLWRSGATLPMVAGIHLGALVAIEVASRGRPNSNRLLARAVALVGAGALAFGAAWWVFDKSDGLASPGLCAACGPFAWGAMIVLYRRARKDVAMLAIAGAAIVLFVTSGIAKVLSEAFHEDAAILLVTGLALTGEVAALAYWLRHERKHGEDA
jgi:uncharacterized membrane protein